MEIFSLISFNAIFFILFTILGIYILHKLMFNFKVDNSNNNCPITIHSSVKISDKEDLLLIKLRNKEVLVGRNKDNGFMTLSEIIYKKSVDKAELNTPIISSKKFNLENTNNVYSNLREK